MAHGTPDWAEIAPKKTVYATIDLAELAARLGSIVTFDRRGDVIFLDSFEGGIEKWGHFLYGDGAAIEWTSKEARSGAFSCKMTTGKDDDQAATLQGETPYPVLSKLGMEVSFSCLETLNIFQIQFEVTPWPNLTLGGLQYLPPSNTLKYQDEDGNWQNLDTDLSHFAFTRNFNTMKIVTDPLNHKYVRAIFNNNSYDMSTLTLAPARSAIAPCLRRWIRVEGPALANITSYVDDVIITQNEP